MNVRRYEIEAGVTWLVEWYEKVTSTNDLAHKTDAHEPYRVIVAEYQTHGRGQHGRRWHAPAGENLLATFCLPAPRILRGGVRSMAAALAVHNVLQHNGLTASLKWPNDVLVGGAKIAGVLIEAKPHRLIVGIGLNVHWPKSRVAGDDGIMWTSMLAETGRSFDRESVLVQMASAVHLWYTKDPQEVVAAYKRWWCKRDAPVHVRRGHEWVKGFVHDLNSDASIRVLTEDGAAFDVHSSADLRQTHV